MPTPQFPRTARALASCLRAAGIKVVTTIERPANADVLRSYAVAYVHGGLGVRICEFPMGLVYEVCHTERDAAGVWRVTGPIEEMKTIPGVLRGLDQAMAETSAQT
jgi:hypothetical protein